MRSSAPLCVPSGIVQVVRTFERRHADLVAQHRLRNVDRNRAMQIVSVPFENRVLLDGEENVEIAVRAAVGAGLAFSRNAQTIAVARCRPARSRAACLLTWR